MVHTMVEILKRIEDPKLGFFEQNCMYVYDGRAKSKCADNGHYSTYIQWLHNFV